MSDSFEKRVSFRAKRGERTRLACCFPRPRGKVERRQQTSVARAKSVVCFRVVGEGASEDARSGRGKRNLELSKLLRLQRAKQLTISNITFRSVAPGAADEVQPKNKHHEKTDNPEHPSRSDQPAGFRRQN